MPAASLSTDVRWAALFQDAALHTSRLRGVNVRQQQPREEPAFFRSMVLYAILYPHTTETSFSHQLLGCQLCKQRLVLRSPCQSPSSAHTSAPPWAPCQVQPGSPQLCQQRQGTSHTCMHTQKPLRLMTTGGGTAPASSTNDMRIAPAHTASHTHVVSGQMPPCSTAPHGEVPGPEQPTTNTLLGPAAAAACIVP